MSDGLLEHVGSVRLEEGPPSVTVLDRGELPGALDLQFADLHRGSLARGPGSEPEGRPPVALVGDDPLGPHVRLGTGDPLVGLPERRQQGIPP